MLKKSNKKKLLKKKKQNKQNNKNKPPEDLKRKNKQHIKPEVDPKILNPKKPNLNLKILKNPKKPNLNLKILKNPNLPNLKIKIKKIKIRRSLNNKENDLSMNQIFLSFLAPKNLGYSKELSVLRSYSTHGFSVNCLSR